MPPRARPHPTSRLIHGVNVSALLLGGVILLLTAVTKPAQLLLLLPVLVLLGVYGRCWTHPSVVAGYFGLALALGVWIVLCEHIVLLDQVLGTQLSKHLSLGARLAAYVHKTLPPAGTHAEMEPCCNDPLTWHYRPGSRYRATFDCPTCAVPYEVTVDETGYLNQPRGLGMEVLPWADEMSAMQREGLRAFAQTQGWHFLDLTEPLRAAAQGGAVWLYGYYDQSHLSPPGTAMVADILAAELLQIIRINEEVRQQPPTP